MPRAVRTRRVTGPMLLALCSVLLSCGQVRPVTGGDPAPACRITPGPAPSQCSLMGSDADWLPPAYVRNATCRCQRTPNSPSANCVRGRLEQIVRTAPRRVRETWLEKRVTLLDAGKRAAYEKWLLDEAAPMIYRWHRESHARCCCPNALPPYTEWSKVVTTPFESCSDERALTHFGNCRGPRGSW